MPIRHKHPHTEQEFTEKLVDPVRQVVGGLSYWSEVEGLPDVLITEVGRTDQMQLNYYVPYAWRILHISRNGRDYDGDRVSLTITEQRHVTEILKSIVQHGTEELGIAMWAMQRYTWHRPFCGCDLRNSHYSPDQLKRVVAWLQRELTQRKASNPREEWEFLVHDIGRGNHIHLAFKDRQRQEDFLRNWRPDIEKLRIPPRPTP